MKSVLDGIRRKCFDGIQVEIWVTNDHMVNNSLSLEWIKLFFQERDMINLVLPAYGLWSTEYASTSELGIAVHRTKKNGPKNRTFRTTTCYMT